jgi:hypothetical protein
MKAIKIDAINRTVSEVEIKDWQEIAPAIGADMFTCVGIEDEETLYIDDEGLFNAKAFFTIEGYPEPLANDGLILGTDGMGESKDTALTVEEVKGMVKFLSPLQVRMMYA